MTITTHHLKVLEQNLESMKDDQMPKWAINACYRLAQLMKNVHEGQEMTIRFKRKGGKIIMITPKEEILG